MEVSGLASRPGRLTPLLKSPRYVLDKRLGGPQNRSGQSGEEKSVCPCWYPNSGRPTCGGRGTVLSHSVSLVLMFVIPARFRSTFQSMRKGICWLIFNYFLNRNSELSQPNAWRTLFRFRFSSPNRLTRSQPLVCSVPGSKWCWRHSHFRKPTVQNKHPLSREPNMPWYVSMDDVCDIYSYHCNGPKFP
jgi:hypothetical protein